MRILRVVSGGAARAHDLARLAIGLALSRRPDLVVISQGANHDGCFFAEVCRRFGVPYVIVSQKATEQYWPSDWKLKTIAAVYNGARGSFFVSEHNRRLTEEQLGFPVLRAAVVRNPFLVEWEPRSDWPDDRELRLACIARLYPKEKGQDILLRVLSRSRWRERPISVTFYGEGVHGKSLERMARYYGLTNVTFAGFVRDIPAIWDKHHGLVLPSRCEGLPLVLVETMLSGRVPIVTAIGGNAEVIDDGRTGFVAQAPTEDALDEAMERAWNERNRWREIGAAAARHIRTLVPPEPERCFADRLVEIVRSEAVSIVGEGRAVQEAPPVAIGCLVQQSRPAADSESP